jgi:AAA+ superfamily predicted ATPase
VIFFYAEDEYYYSSSSQDELLVKYDITEIIAFPNINDIQTTVRNHNTKVAFIAPYLPSSIDKTLEKTSFFEIIDLHNKHGILTTGQVKAGIPEEVALREKLGIDIHRPTVTMADYGGAENLIAEARGVAIKEKYGFPVKGFMLTGIPGTGKSFFAKCFAGETNRLLVELNLSQLMEQPNTIHSLNAIFYYFITHAGKYVIWIDEIEKMLVGEKAIQVLGVLLTRINDLNSSKTSSIFLIATANNISDIAHRNPEFLRNGRFDQLLFIMPPREENAKNMFDMYVRKAQKDFLTNKLSVLISSALEGSFEKEGTRAKMIQDEVIIAYNNDPSIDVLTKTIEIFEAKYKFEFDSDEFVRKAMVEHREKASTSRFIYVPAEIEYIVQDVYFSYYFVAGFIANNEEKEDVYEKFTKKYKPLQIALAGAIDAMTGAANSFVKI